MASAPVVAATAVGAYVGWKVLDSRYGALTRSFGRGVQRRSRRLSCAVCLARCTACASLQISSDLTYLPRFARALRELEQLRKDGSNTARLFLRTVAKQPKNEAIVFENRVLTFQQLDEQSNRVAQWALAQGFKFDDCVALFMENRPEYVVWWMGFTKIGVRIALINTNLRYGLATLVPCRTPVADIASTRVVPAVASPPPTQRQGLPALHQHCQRPLADHRHRAGRRGLRGRGRAPKSQRPHWLLRYAASPRASWLRVPAGGR